MKSIGSSWENLTVQLGLKGLNSNGYIFFQFLLNMLVTLKSFEKEHIKF